MQVMATFASIELSKRLTDDAPEDEIVEEPKKGPRVLETGEQSSLYKLKNELLKKQSNVVKKTRTETYVSGKSKILTVKKDEKEKLLRESDERKARIASNELALKREEEEALERAQKKLKDKAELYERLAEGNMVLDARDSNPVEFMVDFDVKKRKADEEKRERRREYEREECAPSTSFGRAPVPERFHHTEEQRVFGVSHMRLSANEEKRRETIEDLLKYSKEAKAERRKKRDEHSEAEKKRREKINKLRLKKGLEPLPEPVEEEVNLDEIPIPAPHETPEQRHARLMKSDREWDRGKGLYTQWIEKQRDDRDDEFRPPDSYFD